MNNTITLSQLITRLAASTGVDNNSARRFLRAFFAAIEDALADGLAVSVKGIGTFRSVSNELNGGKFTVSYTPDDTITAELNRPFEMFNAVVLADGVDFSENIDKDASDNTVDAVETIESTDETDKFETIDFSDKIETVDIGDHLITIDEKNAKQEPENIEEEVTEDDEESLAARVRTILWPEEEEEKDDDDEITTYTTPIIENVKSKTTSENTTKETTEDSKEPDHKKLWIWGGITVVAVSVIAYLTAVFTTPVDPISTDIAQNQNSEEVTLEAADNTITEISVDEASPTPNQVTATATAKEEPKIETTPPAKKEPVYDTVEVSLIRLAKKHYGEGSYWVFIYDANREIISNPNKIRPGQKVVIPDRSTLPGNSISETKAIAKKKQSEILEKFK